MAKCSHINKQYKNKAGVLEDLACELEAGHEGDHQAEHEHLVTEYKVNGDRMAVSGFHTERVMGYWSDAAGTHAVPVVVTQEEDFKRLRKARLKTDAQGTGAEFDDGLTRSKLDKEG